MPTYSLTTGTMPADFCPENWQTIADTLGGIYSVAVADNPGVVISASTPSVADQDKLWVKLDAAVPYVVGSFVYSSGGWRRIPGLPIYYADGSGTPNSIVITTGDSISNAGFIAGRIFLIKVANAVTGATTVTLDSLGALTLKKGDNEDIESGDIKQGQLILIAYDSAAGVWELLNVLPTVVAAETKKTVTGFAIPANQGDSVTLDFTSLGTVSDYHIWFYRTGSGTDMGWEEGDELDIISVYCDEGATKVPFVVHPDGTLVKIIRPVAAGTNIQVANKSTGVVNNIVESKWMIKATAWA